MKNVSSIAMWVFIIASAVIVLLLTLYQRNKDAGAAKKQNQLKLNKNGNNDSIRITVLDDPDMRAAGFSESGDGLWRYHKDVGNQVCFDLAVAEADESDILITVTTGNPPRPYDYRKILLADPTQETAQEVRSNVEGEMEYLKEKGVLRGHRYGDFI